MGQPKAWFWGLVPLVVLLFCAVYLKQGSMEADIAARARAQLPAGSQEWAQITISGRDATLVGVAPSVEAQNTTPEAVRAVFGLRKAMDGTTLLAEKSPFIFSATLETGALSLAGFAPPGAPLNGLATAAKTMIPTAQVTTKVEAARGFPAGDWPGATATLFKAMGLLAKGVGRLNGSVLSLTGTGQLGITEAEVREALKALPAGFTLGTITIEPGVIKPYPFAASRGEGSISLSGYVPNAAAQNDLLAYAKSVFENERVEDALKEGPGAPRDYISTIKSGLLQLARLAPGASLTVMDSAITLKGNALHPAARDEIMERFKRSIPNAGIELGVAPLGPPIRISPECQKLYSDALASHTIRFSTGASEITAESYPLLDRLAVVSLRCDEAQIEIGGHTDSDGSPEANAELSTRRAEAVLSFLSRAGVPQTRIGVIGYGATRPVATNDTPQNKAKNRRIEFTVK